MRAAVANVKQPNCLQTHIHTAPDLLCEQVLWACATLGVIVPQDLLLEMLRATRGPVALAAFSPQSLSNILWALAAAGLGTTLVQDGWMASFLTVGSLHSVIETDSADTGGDGRLDMHRQPSGTVMVICCCMVPSPYVWLAQPHAPEAFKTMHSMYSIHGKHMVGNIQNLFKHSF